MCPRVETHRISLMSAKKTAVSLSFACVTLLSGAYALGAQPSAAAGSVVPASLAIPTASRAQRAPIIDGRDDDDSWHSAVSITGFRMFDPTEDGEPAMRTSARITYDDRNLYVFVRAFDPHPDSIISLLSRRDLKTSSDQIKLMIDSYHDRRTGYEFAVNPAGVKRDYYTYDDGNQEDVSWDAVWDVATQVDSLGWTAEFRIPLSQLRYAPAAEHTFGLMIVREIARLSERDAWPVLRRSRPGVVSQFGDVGGFIGLASPRRMELTPYVLTRNSSTMSGNGLGRSQQGTAGADLKYGITSNLTLDATVNPDFGQVEADPAQLNLTAFETFLTEQRPFFLEGTGIFQFGDDVTRLFYSRRIGRAPQLTGLVTDAGVEVPGASRILGAGKLTGRLSNGISLGVLGAVTDRTEAGETVVEPRTSYGMLRATRDFRDGESAVGIAATVVDRALDATSENYLRKSAYVVGADGRHRFAGGRYAVAASFSASEVRGAPSAIVSTEENGVHEYQRPDDALRVDSSLTRLAGSALGLSAEKVSGLVRASAAYQRVTPGYESNDLGFLSRADFQTVNNTLRFYPAKPVGNWRNPFLGLYTYQGFTTAGLPTSATLEAYASGTRANGSSASVDLWTDNVGPVYCDRCARGGPAVRLSPAYNVLVNVAANPKLRVSPQFAAIYTLGDDGHSRLWRVRPYVVLRPSSRLGLELGTRYQRNEDNTQWLANVGEIGADSTHYLFGHLDQDLLSFTGRMDFTIHPTMSFQLYAEPFVTAGWFRDVRELRDARASSYEARFRPYAGTPPDGSFNTKSFNASAVARWEYRPGSTVFVVWTQARQQDDLDAGTFGARRDYANLFAVRPENVFLIKAAYWLGR
jgi:hypothetical protein